ncbi:hypothetical protein [Pseudomonas sp. GOM6]|uniref:hypothetical protein n=1 Tax=Pseudomonas sp. GOM6 TaxID=3036944 RepID=UPI0024095D25|nr:hypothetical protein [Pseudomonas sp. GOM6]MDG1580404.1 hypothetical protein [Pseudomonas sp. GOM6]
MRRYSLCVLLCLLPLLSPAQSSERLRAQQLSEIASRSRLLCASALLYFDPQQRTLDPRGLTAAYYHLNSLETLVLQLGQPAALQQPLLALKDSFNRLDRLPPSERARYPQLLEPLLSQQRSLLQALEGEEGAVQGSPPVVNLLQRQSLDLARLLLDYQMRHYPWPQTRSDLLTAAQRQQVDQAVGQRFGRLEQALPEQAAALRSIRRHYQFVRNPLQSNVRSTSGGAEFYLSRAVLDLNELAANLP